MASAAFAYRGGITIGRSGGVRPWRAAMVEWKADDISFHGVAISARNFLTSSSNSRASFRILSLASCALAA